MNVPVATVARAWLTKLSLAEAQRVGQEFELLVTSVTSTASVRRFLLDPRRSLMAKTEAVRAAGFSLPVQQMVRWLTEARRLGELTTLVPQVQRVVRNMGGPTQAQVVSAIALAAPERTALTKKLEQFAGHSVELHAAVKPTLLGGLVVTLAGRRRDLSLKGRIEGLRAAAAV